MRSPYTVFRTRSTDATLQLQPIPGEENRQVQNSAGGYVYKLDPWKQLERFLILGTEGGTYYVGQKELTIKNAQVIKKLIEEDGLRVVNTVVAISDGNRAPKADTLLFTLAMCISFGDTPTKRAVAEALPRVARIGTHLFMFVGYAEQFRGWGRVLRQAVANWYTRHGAALIEAINTELNEEAIIVE